MVKQWFLWIPLWSTEFVQNYPTTFSAGNYLQVENTFGSPDFDSFSTELNPFQEVEIRDQRIPITHLAEALDATEVGVDVDSVAPT